MYVEKCSLHVTTPRYMYTCTAHVRTCRVQYALTFLLLAFITVARVWGGTELAISTAYYNGGNYVASEAEETPKYPHKYYNIYDTIHCTGLFSVHTNANRKKGATNGLDWLLLTGGQEHVWLLALPFLLLRHALYCLRCSKVVTGLEGRGHGTAPHGPLINIA